MISLVQLVAGVTVLLAPCPMYEAGTSCYVEPTRTIYVSPLVAPSHRPRVILHDYGHAWDLDHPELDRRRITRLLGFPASTRWWGRGIGRDEDSPAESFAEAYMVCALGGHRLWIRTERISVHRICAMLPRSASAIWRQRLG